MHALRIWRPYLLDRPFWVETDHQTLQDILTQSTCSQRLARWLNLLSEYRPEFKWIPGHTNDTADGLSRRVDFCPEDRPASSIGLRDFMQSILDTNLDAPVEDLETSLNFANADQAMMVFHLLSSKDIAALCRMNYPSDRQFGSIWKNFLREGRAQEQVSELVSENNSLGRFSYSNNLLWFAGKTDANLRLCIPDHSKLKMKILFSEHDDPSRGHPGTYKTMHFVRQKYYWKHMDEEVKKYIRSCEKCQRNKYRQTRAPGLLQCLPVPEARWQHITMDFILSLPICGNFNSIWVIVDRLTKRSHFIPINMSDSESSARACAMIFRKEYQRLHGIPESIISDRDTRFTSTFWQEFMTMQGSFHKLSSAFRPNTDGQTERTNRFIEDYIRNYVHANQDNWVELLYSAEIAYNSRYHESIRMSPFEADLGYIPRSVPDHVFDGLIGTKSKPEILLLGQEQQRVMEQLKINLVEAQNRMKKYYNSNRPIQVFEIGDKVMLSSKNLNIEHLGISKSGTTKFGPLWIGPYPVIATTSIDTYKLQLPVGLRLHPEFHTSLLKPYSTDSNPDRFNKPNEGMIGAGGIKDAYLIEDVVDHKRSKGEIYYLVKWVGYSFEHNTWEPLSNIRKPAVCLIDNYLARIGLDKAVWNPVIKVRRSRR